MKVSNRSTSLVVLGATLSLALLACKPLDKETGKPVDGSDDKAGSPAVAARGGMKTEREQVSYVIGMQIGDSLKAAKDEVDLDTLFKAVRSTIDGKEPLLGQEEAMQVMQDFGMRMQAKQMAEMQEAAKRNAEEGEKFLAGNGNKEGVQATASGLQYQVLTAGEAPRPATRCACTIAAPCSMARCSTTPTPAASRSSSRLRRSCRAGRKACS
jgi:FKBP-type peptidyl-prolyl cis-trans isomerase FkpA